MNFRLPRDFADAIVYARHAERVARAHAFEKEQSSSLSLDLSSAGFQSAKGSCWCRCSAAAPSSSRSSSRNSSSSSSFSSSSSSFSSSSCISSISSTGSCASSWRSWDRNGVSLHRHSATCGQNNSKSPDRFTILKKQPPRIPPPQAHGACLEVPELRSCQPRAIVPARQLRMRAARVQGEFHPQLDVSRVLAGDVLRLQMVRRPMQWPRCWQSHRQHLHRQRKSTKLEARLRRRPRVLCRWHCWHHLQASVACASQQHCNQLPSLPQQRRQLRQHRAQREHRAS